MDDTNKEDKKCEREQAAYLALMKLHNTNRIDYNDRKWGTIQFFQTLITALLVLAATLALYSFKDGDYSWYVIFITILLLVAAMIAAWYAPKNLARESKLVFKE